jgi:hypothetical protein
MAKRTIRDAKLARRQHEQRFAGERIETYAVIVKRNGSTQVPGVYDHIWVLPYGVGEPVAVYNRRVKSTRPNTAVAIGYAPGSTTLEVLRTVIDTTAGVVPTGTVDLPNHASSHYPDGDDPLYIYGRAIAVLLCYPAGGLKVNVAPYTYEKDGAFVTFPGVENYDLSAHLPAAGQALRVLVHLNLSTNQIGAVAGSAVVDSGAILPPAPAIPAGVQGAALVRLAGGQSELAESDFYEARDFLGGGGGGSTRYPGPGEIVIGTTIYADLDAAEAAASAGDQVLIGPGTYSYTGTLTWPAGVDVRGAGVDVTVIQSPDGRGVQVEDGVICDLSITTVDPANTFVYPLLTLVGSCYYYNLKLTGTNSGSGIINGISTTGTVTGVGSFIETNVDGNGLDINNGADMVVGPGNISGGTNDILVHSGATAKLNWPRCANSDVVVSGTATGVYLNGDGVPVFGFATPSDGQALIWSGANSRWEPGAAGGGAHAADHVSGGSDEVDGDQLDIDWNPANYTPSTAPTEATSVDHLTAHLAGIDGELAGIGQPPFDANGNASGLILDADGDTKLESQSDDWVKLWIGGSVELNVNSAGLQLLTGARIDQVATSLVNNHTNVPTGAAVKAYVDPAVGFRVTKTSSQEIANATDVKITWESIDFDTESDFSLALERHTPSKAGLWVYILTLLFQESGNGKEFQAKLYRNGGLYKYIAEQPGGAGWITFQIISVSQMNGSSNYMEAYARHTLGANATLAASVTSFEGFYLGTI